MWIGQIQGGGKTFSIQRHFGGKNCANFTILAQKQYKAAILLLSSWFCQFFFFFPIFSEFDGGKNFSPATHTNDQCVCRLRLKFMESKEDTLRRFTLPLRRNRNWKQSKKSWRRCRNCIIKMQNSRYSRFLGQISNLFTFLSSDGYGSVEFCTRLDKNAYFLLFWNKKFRIFHLFGRIQRGRVKQI